jgi:hypothetical protein
VVGWKLKFKNVPGITPWVSCHLQRKDSDKSPLVEVAEMASLPQYALKESALYLGESEVFWFALLENLSKQTDVDDAARDYMLDWLAARVMCTDRVVELREAYRAGERAVVDYSSVMDELVIVGRYYVMKGEREFSDFRRVMLAEFGQGIRDVLGDLYRLSVEAADAMQKKDLN